MIGKALPFGIGAAVGGAGNHILGRRVIVGSRRAFGVAPAAYPAELEPRPGAARLETSVFHTARRAGAAIGGGSRRVAGAVGSAVGGAAGAVGSFVPGRRRAGDGDAVDRGDAVDGDWPAFEGDAVEDAPTEGDPGTPG